MRVLQLTCVFPPYGGGIGRVAAAYARELASEHEVTVFTPRYPGRPQPQAMTGVRVEGLRPLAWYGNGAFLPQLLGRLKDFDVVHLHYPFFGAQELLAFASAIPKLVITYHMVPRASGFKGQVFRLATNLVDKRLGERARLLITQTRDYLDEIAAKRLGHKERWQVLPLGVDERFSSGAPSQALRHHLHVRDGVPILLFVGSLDAAHEFKGLSVLLRAMKRLPRPCHLVVIGQGNLKSRYESEAAQLDLKRQVTFAGFVSQAELPTYFQLVDALVLPSLNEAEAFGLVLLEAMACGVPVIASRLPGVRELVREREVGLLTNPGDELALAAALEEMLSDGSAAQAMGQRGAALVERAYRWPAIGERLRQMYRTML